MLTPWRTPRFRHVLIAAPIIAATLLLPTLPSSAAGAGPSAANASAPAAAGHDPALHRDAHGGAYWVDAGAERDEQSGPTVAGPAAPTRAPFPYAQTFALHSKPGSQRTIYLDVDGHRVSGTLWNQQGLPALDYPAWDPAGNGPAFSDSEKALVQSVWQRVAEDYAPFDVDVTTADPGQPAITRTDAADQVFGTRVLITPSKEARTSLPGCGGVCGGLAYNGAFDVATDHDKQQPAWVFPQGLANNAKFVAEAASHEVGHTFGLSHDDISGDNQNGYYTGHGMWAPIMGSSYDQPVTQWSNGATAGSINTEDDMAVIAANGAPLRTDEAGEVVATAADLPAPGVRSYIGSRTDVDVFDLGSCSGPVAVAADPAAVSPNLDLRLSLLSAAGQVVSTQDKQTTRSDVDRAGGMDADVVLNAGDTLSHYYAKVEGVGLLGNSNPTTGYDDYGSVGAYTLTATGCGIAEGAPGAPSGLALVLNGTTATVSWAKPAQSGTSAVTSYRVFRNGLALGDLAATGTASMSRQFAGLAHGSLQTFAVAAINASGLGPVAIKSITLPVVKPTAPVIAAGTPGAAGGAISARASWKAPTDNGGAALKNYQIYAYQLDSKNKVVKTFVANPIAASFLTAEITVPTAAKYQFAVRALNSAGWSPLSKKSKPVPAR